jgi:phage tail-like protein
MRFGVKTANTDYLAAGFSACSTPEASNEAVEYREGQQVYTQKFPGLPTMSDLTLSKGVVLTGNQFYNWMFAVIEGAATYRDEIIIAHFHRAALAGFQNADLSGADNASAIANDATPRREYTCTNAFPIRCKVAADLDATSSDVSVSELDIAYEAFSIANIT